jgi:hypothetical protein
MSLQSSGHYTTTTTYVNNDHQTNTLPNEAYLHIAKFSTPTIVANTNTILVITPSIVASTRTRFTTIYVHTQREREKNSLIFMQTPKDTHTDAKQRFLPQQAFPIVDDLLELDADLDPALAETDAGPEIDVAAERADADAEAEARALRDEIEAGRCRKRDANDRHLNADAHRKHRNTDAQLCRQRNVRFRLCPITITSSLARCIKQH